MGTGVESRAGPPAGGRAHQLRIIVLGIVSRFLYQINRAPNGESNSRLIYTIVVASISTFYSLLFVLPFKYTFMAFPFDLVMFILWLVVFCLDETVRTTLR